MSLVDFVREDYGIKKVSSDGRWWRSDTHSSLVVDASKDKFFFNARNLSGGPIEYLTKVRGLPFHSAKDLINALATRFSPVTADEEYVPQIKHEKLVELFYEAGINSRDYWYSRTLTDSTINRYRLGFHEGWYTIPIYDNGRFINFQCRRDEPSKRIKLWYKDTGFAPVLFNNDILKFVDKVYICEGMVDCILLNQIGLPSVCSTSGAMSWNPGWIRYFTRLGTIYYIADNDKAGIQGGIMVAKSIGTSRVKIFRFAEKAEKYDTVDFFREGGTKEMLLTRLENEAQALYGVGI